jgi:hypothetical protein
MNKLNYHKTPEILSGASQEKPHLQLGGHQSPGMNQLFPLLGENEHHLSCCMIDL